MPPQPSPKRFSLVLIKPSHYDDDGYVIQWLRSAIPSNTLAVLNGLALDCHQRRVLGDDVVIDISSFDEANARIRPERIARRIAGGGGRGMVALVGVQTNQFPRAMDIARRLRAAGVQVCIGGFHVSGCLAMLPDLTPELKEAMDLGISLFAGEAEGRLEIVLRDAWNGALRPLYNYMDDLPSLEGAAIPILPAAQIKRTGGGITSFDAGRGCPFLCSFCTIINVQGRKSRRPHGRRCGTDRSAKCRAGRQALLRHRRQLLAQRGLGKDFRPPHRAAAAGQAGHPVRDPGGCHVPPASRLHREGRARRGSPRVRRGSRASTRAAWPGPTRNRTGFPSIARCCCGGSRPALR